MKWENVKKIGLEVGIYNEKDVSKYAVFIFYLFFLHL